jgi:hypothetical protein
MFWANLVFFSAFSEQVIDHPPVLAYKDQLYAAMTSRALSLPAPSGLYSIRRSPWAGGGYASWNVLSRSSDSIFFVFLYSHRKDIAELVSDHLGLCQSNHCRLGDLREQILGSFNVCISLYVENWNRCPAKRVLIQFPLLYKVGESAYAGNADEKLRCEAVSSPCDYTL